MRSKASNAWVEIRNSAGAILESIPATIERGAICARLPAFPAGQLGTIQVCTSSAAGIERDEGRLEELPAEPMTILQLIG